MGKKFSEEEIEQISKSSRASVEMEGLSPSSEAEEISKRYLKGEISNKEAKRLILKLHGIYPTSKCEMVSVGSEREEPYLDDIKS